MSYLSNLNWRFATKSFDPEKSVSRENLEKILEAIRLSPSSFGIQPFHVYVISNKNVREKLKLAAFGQLQVTNSSYLLVFCARTDPAIRAQEFLKERFESLKGAFQGLDVNWSAKQAYIALGFGVAACAELEIDSCPMEGFSSEEVDKILNLPSNLKSVAFLTVGYRKEEPKHPKSRFPREELFTEIV